MRRIELLDSTLRDGAQGEGISFSVRDKLAIARTLDEIGIDVVEAGNPGSNPKDIEFFREARGLGLSRVKLAAFGATRRKGTRASEDDALARLLGADTEIVVIFGKSSPLHVTRVLGASLEENLDMIAESVSLLRKEGRRVIYDAEHFFDAFADDPGYALSTLAAAATAGAECLVLCDTNGGSLPDRIAQATLQAVAAYGLPVGIHAHDDSGLAVANSLAAVAAGASQVQGTLVGFGERCGNANLSTVAANLILKLGLDCLAPGALPRLSAASRKVAAVANIGFDEGMAFVGRRAFAHKAGMHVDAVAKLPQTFEHVPPEAVGNERRFLASELGGRAAVMERVRRMEPDAKKDSPLVAAVLAKLKEGEAAGYQYEGAEASLDLLIRKTAGRHTPFFEFIHFRTIGEQPAKDRLRCAQATVLVEVGGEREMSAAEGDGPVHALDLALRKALERFYPSLGAMRLTDYKVRVLDAGTATASRVRVLIESADEDEAWTTVGVSADIVEASWIALVDSIEHKLIKDLERREEKRLRERSPAWA